MPTQVAKELIRHQGMRFGGSRLEADDAIYFEDRAFVIDTANGLKIGAGDPLFYSAAATKVGRKLTIADGTSQLPATGIGPTVRISKYEQTDSALMVNATSIEQTAALSVFAENTATSESQVTAGFFYAKTISEVPQDIVTGNPDGAALNAIAEVGGNGVGFGYALYAVGRRTTATGKALGAEIRVANITGSDSVFPSAPENDPFPDTMALLIDAQGDATALDPIRTSGVGIMFGRSTNGQINTAIAIGSVGGITTARDRFLYDYGSSITSYEIAGTHTTGILIGGTNTAAIAVKADSGPVVIGNTAPILSTTLLEVYSGVAADPIAQFGSGVAAAYSVRLRNSTGVSVWFVANAADEFLTGTVQGDSGLKPNTAKSIHLGGFTSVIEVTSDNKLAFFNGATPVLQQAGIVDATADLAELTTKFNTLLQKLENYGLLAAA